MIYIDDIPINITLFPDNTSQVWKLPKEIIKKTYVQITWKFHTEGEFMHLAQLDNLLEKYGIERKLYLPYLPYARQDKTIDNNQTFALVSFTILLNSLGFSDIVCMDPHSSRAKELINNFKAIYPTEIIHYINEKTAADLFCYPDKGAKEKYSEIFFFQPSIYGEKIRDQASGFITSYELFGDPKDKSILIVDDICDGGATFVYLSQALIKAGAKEVNLFVSHGIFSKGLKPLYKAGIKRIFTIDGEVSEYQNGLTYRRI